MAKQRSAPAPTQNYLCLGCRREAATGWQPGWSPSPLLVWDISGGKVHVLQLWHNVSSGCLWARTHVYAARFVAGIRQEVDLPRACWWKDMLESFMASWKPGTGCQSTAQWGFHLGKCKRTSDFPGFVLKQC